MKKRFMALIVIALMLVASLAMAATEVSFAWTDPNPADKVAGYIIYRSETGTKPWERIDSELITETHYTYKVPADKEAECWFYCVVEDKEGNKSLPSDIVHLAPPVTGFKCVIQISVTLEGNGN